MFKLCNKVRAIIETVIQCQGGSIGTISIVQKFFYSIETNNTRIKFRLDPK